MRALLAVVLLLLAGAAQAHEVRPAYLQIDQAGPDRYTVIWKTPQLSGMPLPVVLTLPEGARTLTGPGKQEMPGATIERSLVEVPGGLAGKRIDFVGLQATIADVLARITVDGRTTTSMINPSQPWLDVPAEQSTLSLAVTYVRTGIAHILFGFDHLLFVASLMLIVRDWRVMVKTITAFTVAHSITLALATFGWVTLPPRPVEAMVALSIVLVSAEAVRLRRGETSLAIESPWVVAFAFASSTASASPARSSASACPAPTSPSRSSPSTSASRSASSSSSPPSSPSPPRLAASSPSRAPRRSPPPTPSAPWPPSGASAASTRSSSERPTMTHSRLALTACLLLLAGPALAHTGTGAIGGFHSGFFHPLTGPDHIVAMVAVGLWGVFLGAPAIWLLPIIFPLVMACGGALGILGVPLPGIETGIALSALVLGLCVALALRPPLWIAAVIVGFFAIFHGYAHGAEMPEASSPVAYAIGFVVATGLLHLSGIVFGSLARWDAGRVAVRAAGGLIALAGAAFLTGVA